MPQEVDCLRTNVHDLVVDMEQSGLNMHHQGMSFVGIFSKSHHHSHGLDLSLF